MKKGQTATKVDEAKETIYPTPVSGTLDDAERKDPFQGSTKLA